MTRGEGQRRMVVVTPYSPLETHDHAADDLAPHWLQELGALVDLHVIAPHDSEDTSIFINGVWHHNLAKGRKSKWARYFGLYPAFAREDWTKAHSRTTRRIIAQLAPDNVHIEYLQPLESVLRQPTLRWTVTLHDVTEQVFSSYLRQAAWWVKPYRLAEWVRVRKLERTAVSQAEVVFGLSNEVSEFFAFRAKKVATLRIGVPKPEQTWSPPKSESDPQFVFAGAMWRAANVATAIYLAQDVMPLVREVLPTAQLRIVGARPGQAVLELDGRNGIEVIGRVDSIDQEYARATAVFAPTVVRAGVLIKAVRAMNCGVPMILNTLAAVPLEIETGVHALVADSAEQFAAAAIHMANNPVESARISESASNFVHERFSWAGYAQQMMREISSAWAMSPQ